MLRNGRKNGQKGYNIIDRKIKSGFKLGLKEVRE
jgi:hypothetical protein